MSRYLAGRLRGLTPYVPGERTDAYQLRLNFNESPYPPLPQVEEAVRDAARGLNRYADPDCTALREAIGRVNGLPKECVLAANGLDQVLFLSLLAFAGPERPIRLPDITYTYYDDFIAVLGIPCERVPLKEDFTIDPEDYMTPGVMPVIVDPNAPTGLALPKGAVEAILRADPNRPVIIDEAYAGFGAESSLPLIRDYPNLIIARTLSKGAALAGARVGYALGQKEIISELASARSLTDLYGVSAMGQAAGIAALENWDLITASCQRIAAERDRAAERLRALNCEVLPSLTNFLFVRPPAPAGSVFKALKERGALVRHWDHPRVKDYLRVSVGTGEEMDRFIAILSEILEGAL
ncbi:MAG: aminotransferase class I/II-fold pyridoxal phosphate-dependent enzyme [Clostridia bacterium]|nr:aminotransferase class I/II-fold pyridoxal phosphate-dependent enzyme [Clostridia bacterium]